MEAANLSLGLVVAGGSRSALGRASMRALVQARYGGAEELALSDRERPTPGPEEVLVEVRAAGLDRGTWHLMTGRPYMMRLVFGFRAPKNPVPGRDLAGVVAAVGSKVTQWRVGDEVFGVGEGTCAQYAVASASKLARKPARLGFEESAVLGISGLTALQSLRDGAKVKPGQRVLIVGASGGVGTYAVQLAKELGAHVTGVCSAQKVELVRSLGADRVSDYTREDFTACGERFDAILDVGGNTPLSALRRVLAPQGTLVFVGGEQGGDWSGGFGRQLRAFALAPFVKQRFVAFMAREVGDDLARIGALAERGAVSPALDRRCSLAEVPQAMRDLEAGKVRGKVAVSLS